MILLENEIYHIYNQGNNKQQLFYQERNYDYFLRLTNKFIAPYCDILSYCLMPNHFHFMIYSNSESITKIKQGGNETTQLSNGFRKLQVSFALAINKQENRTGSLFRQHAKAKLIDNEQHALTCFHYIHQNPIKANLAANIADWKFSSYNEYVNKNGICNFNKASQVLVVNFDNFIEESKMIIHKDGFFK